MSENRSVNNNNKNSSDDGTALGGVGDGAVAATMFASVCTGYGPASDVFEVRRGLPRPLLSDDDDRTVLIRNEMTTVNPADCKQRSGNLRLLSKHDFPFALGQDFCGTVAAVGPGVSGFQVGDTVIGSTAPRNGCSAEYVLAKPDECAKIDRTRVPSLAGAAAAPTACCTAWKGLFDPAYGNLSMRDSDRDDNGVKPSVLIIGASGSVGSAAVQLAVGVAAVDRVVAVCGASNLDYVRSLGTADDTEVVAIDYRQLSGCDTELMPLRDERFDLVLDCVGGDDYYRTFHPRLNFTNPGALYVTCVGPVLHGGSEPITVRTLLSTAGKLVPRLLGNHLLPGRWNPRYRIYLGFDTVPLSAVARFLEKGVLVPRIDPSSPLPSLEDLAAAHETVETGHSRGKVVVAVAANGEEREDR